MKLTCKTCNSEFNYSGRSTIKPKACPECLRIAKSSKKKEKLTKDKANPKKQLKKDKIEKLLDDEWSLAVKVKAGFKCEYCGATSWLNSHHIFSRSNFSVRWDIENGICLCALHHTLGNFSAHKSPMDFSQWILEYKGQEWYDKLLPKARMTVKLTKEEKQGMLNKLKLITNG